MLYQKEIETTTKSSVKKCMLGVTGLAVPFATDGVREDYTNSSLKVLVDCTVNEVTHDSQL